MGQWITFWVAHAANQGIQPSQLMLLLVDEPSVGLSPLLVSQTIAKIGELNQQLGLTVLMAEQNFNQAIRIASRGYIIVHGEIVVASHVPPTTFWPVSVSLPGV